MRWALLAFAASCRLWFDPLDAGEPTSGPWARVIAGDSTVCGIKPSGEAWCWGDNSNQQTGAGPSATLWHLPVRLPGTWAQLAFSTTHACGVQLDHTLWCWGANPFGELGDGTITPHVELKLVGTDADWRDVGVGRDTTCARKLDDSLWCWGDNQFRQLDGSGVPAYLTPTMIDTSVAAVGSTVDHMCMVHTSGTLWCTGNNLHGELGTGDMLALAGLTRIGPDTDWQVLAVGEHHTCAIKTDGSLWCWGLGDAGRLGLGDTTTRVVPTRVGADRDWVDVKAGDAHTCALKGDGSLWCFGSTMHGALGAFEDDMLRPTLIDTRVEISFAAAHDLTCIVSAGGVMRCTGRRSRGQLAVPGATQEVPVRADTRTDWKSLVITGDGPASTVCGIDTASHLWCWGSNTSGQIGDGTRRDRQQPVQVGTATWSAVSVGPTFTAGISNGSLYEWGQNVATMVIRLSPTQIDANTDWTAVSVGSAHACAARGSMIECWGLGARVGYLAAVPVGSPATAVGGGWQGPPVAGARHTCADQSGGGILCWGGNDTGQLGDGTTTDSATPVAVMCTSPCGGALAKVVSGSSMTCALFAAGNIVCWGTNGSGQFGDGVMVGTPQTGVDGPPTQDWKDLSAGDFHTCGIKADNTLWCWGHNDNGQLGIGAITVDEAVPKQAGTASNWRSVAAGHHGTCAIASDGSRWCWGALTNGEYGDGITWQMGFVVVANDL